MADLLTRLHDALGDRYRLDRELGRGGMATVYLARDLKHDRLVALKVLRPELAHVLGRDRFLREIQIVARLQHPHILPLFDSGEAADQLWYTMPYVEGESLRQRLEREGQLSLDETLRISVNVLAALAYAHKHGIIHRDLKPENILLESGEAVVADFGIAHAVDAAGGEHLTESGLALGTPAYMSPEQAGGRDMVDGRSDIYGFACMLYEMLAGCPPFSGPTPQAVLARHYVDPVPSLHALRPTIPSSLERVIVKALAKVPADRFASAAEFAASLSANSETASTIPASASRPGLEPRGRSTRKRLFGSVAVLLVLVIAAAVALQLWEDSDSKVLDQDRIVVAPFDAVSAPVRVLGEGLVEYLSRSLDGAGTLRTASPSAYLRSWRGTADLSSARALGIRTGSGLVVYGELAMAGRDSVRVRAALVNVGSTSVPEEFEVRGDTARIDLLADSLTLAVLRTVGRNRPVGVVRSTPLGKASIPALKEFLRGEHFYRRSEWDSALAHYDRAIAMDSAFALPYRRMTLVLGWHSPASATYESDRTYAMKAAARNRGLAPRDSLLIVADSLFYVSSGVAYFRDRRQLFQTLEEAARRYPGDPEIWLALGEACLHDGTAAFWGSGEATPAECLRAFDRAIALDSGFTPAYEHTSELSLLLGQPNLARRYLQAEAAATGDTIGLKHSRLLELLLHPVWTKKPEVARLIETASVGRLWSVAGSLKWWPDSAEIAVRLFRSLVYGQHLLNPNAFRHTADSLLRRRGLAVALGHRGHLHEAYKTYPMPEGDHPNLFTDLALLGIVPTEYATGQFRALLENESQWPQNDATGPVPIPTGPRQALSWWFARRDTFSLARMADRAVRSSMDVDAIKRIHLQYLSSVARAYLALARHDSAQAMTEMAALPDSLCLLDTCYFERLVYAQLLAARGRDNEAGQVLDRWIWSRAWSPLSILGALERGRIAERLGQQEKALKSYELVVDTWRKPDPELLPYVAEARVGLQRLLRDLDR